MGMAVYAAVVAAAAVFAALLLTSGIRDFSVELENARHPIYIPDFIFRYLLLPTAFAVFTVLIVLFDRSPYLGILPVTGMAAEGVQFLAHTRDNIYAFPQKDGYFFGTVALDFFSAVLVVLLLIFMFRLTRRDYTINQSRWLIVAAFVPVFARVLLNVCLMDLMEDYKFAGGVSEWADQTKMYLLFGAALVNVKKRSLLSKK